MTDIEKIKEEYERELKTVQKSIPWYESSNNQELKLAVRGQKARVTKLTILIDALRKQIPMEAHFVYDDEFICPACNFEDDGYNVTKLKVCPDCGQKLKW